MMLVPVSSRFRIFSAALIILSSMLWMEGDTVVGQDKELFKEGPVIKSFGKIAKVVPDLKLPKDLVLKVRFDVERNAKAGEINQTFERAARLINLHVDQGVAPENLKVAIVVHGSALLDVSTPDFYGIKSDGKQHGSVEAIRELHRCGVKFYLCGQTAGSYHATRKHLLPVIKIAPSAMTAHAILAKEGYSLIPF